MATLTGTAGGVTATTSLALEVNAPGFSIAPPGGTGVVWIDAGSSASAEIVVTDYAGFTGSVNLAVTSTLPSGVTASWVTNPTTGTSVLTLTASNSVTPFGPALVTVTGTSGTLSATTDISFGIPQTGFYFNSTPLTGSISQNGSVTATLVVVPIDGYVPGPVTMQAAALPSGVTATFNPNPTTTGNSVVTMTASGSAPIGTSELEFCGSTPAWEACRSFPQTVTAPATPTFSLGLSSVYQTLVQGGSATNTVTVNNQNGFTGNVSLSVVNPPVGVTASFSTNPTTGTSVVTLSASNSAIAGFYQVSVGGTSGTQFTFVTLFLQVNAPPSFALGASSGSLTLLDCIYRDFCHKSGMDRDGRMV